MSLSFPLAAFEVDARTASGGARVGLAGTSTRDAILEGPPFCLARMASRLLRGAAIFNYA